MFCFVMIIKYKLTKSSFLNTRDGLCTLGSRDFPVIAASSNGWFDERRKLQRLTRGQESSGACVRNYLEYRVHSEM